MEQSKYQEQGMHLLAVPKRRQMLLPLLGISVFGFVAFFVGIAIFMGAWEEAGGRYAFVHGTCGSDSCRRSFYGILPESTAYLV